MIALSNMGGVALGGVSLVGGGALEKRGKNEGNWTLAN